MAASNPITTGSNVLRQVGQSNKRKFEFHDDHAFASGKGSPHEYRQKKSFAGMTRDR